MKNYIGKLIDGYQVISKQGMGGMAIVYKAYDTHLERDVVIKLIRADAIPAEQHERIMERFEREAKSHASFSHPNIVPVYDFGKVDDIPYLVMAFVSGGTLKDKIGKPISVEQALNWVIPVANALQYAHARQVIHRDVKPRNILITDDGQPALTDFGIAKLLETDERTLTGTGLGVGTPEYMAPEQWLGQSSPASDQYSLGIVLYELLTGQRPYQADTPLGLAYHQKRDPIPPPRLIVPGISEDVEMVLMKVLSYDQTARFKDMAHFHQALVELQASNKELVENYSNPNRQAPVVDKEGKKNVSRHQSAAKTTKVGEQEGNQRIRKSNYKRRRAVGLIIAFLLILAAVGFAYFGFPGEWLGDIRQTNSPSQVVVAVEETLISTSTETPFPTMLHTRTSTLYPTRTTTPTNEPTETPNPDVTRVREFDGMEMVYVPAGEFIFGTAKTGYSTTGVYFPFSTYDVYVDAFWIDRYEVTNAQYARCVDAGVCTIPHSLRSLTHDEYYRNDEFANYPVIYIERQMALTYCTWVGGRLPTDAEWEKAARGTDGREYPWGVIWTSQRLGNYDGSYSDTTAVGSFPMGASPYGAMDMMGNVWEWVSDWYHPAIYATEPVDNPTGPSFGEARVLRGGSYSGGSSYSVYFGNNILSRQPYPYYTTSLEDVGFRCVVDD